LILGIIIWEEGGTPVLTVSFSKIFDEKKAVYLSQLLEALKSFAEVTLGDKLEEIKLSAGYVYLRKYRDFTISVITDAHEPEIKRMVSNISRILKDHTSMEIQLNKHVRERLIREILSQVVIEKTSIDILRDLIENVTALLRMYKPNTRAFPKKIIKAQRISQAFLSRLRDKVAFKQITVNDLFSLFIRGDFDDLIRYATKLFDTNEKDMAIALHSKAAFMLLNRPPDFPAPLLEDTLNIVKKIDDPFLADYLSAELKSIISVGNLLERREVYMKNREFILDIVEKSIHLRDLYLITLLGCMDQGIIDRVLDAFKGKSSLLNAMAYCYNVFLTLINTPPSNIEEWMKLVSSIDSYISELKGKVGWEFLAFSYLLTLWWGNWIPGTKEYDTEFIFDAIRKFWDENREFLVHGDNLLPTYLRGAIWILGYGLRNLIRLILEKKDFVRDAQQFLLEIEDYISEFYAYYQAQRGIKALNITILALLLDIYSRVLGLNNLASYGILDIIKEILEPEMINIQRVNKLYYIIYISSLLATLGNLLLVLPKSSLRDLLLGRIADHLMGLSIHATDISPIHAFILAKALRFYSKIDSEEAKEAVNRILENAERTFPEFINKVFETLVK